MRRLKIFLASMIAALAATACLSGTAGAVSSSAPCNAPDPAFTGYDHVVLWILENHSASSINSSDMPYLTGLAGQCALMTNEKALHHPSLPNYLDLTGGSNFGVTDDSGPSSHPINQTSIFSQMGKAGWRGYHNGMPKNCSLSNGGDHYIVHHNPAAYYTLKNTTYDSRAVCATNDLPLEGHYASDFGAGTVAPFSMVVPNNCHNGHKNTCSNGDGSTIAGQAKQADTYLAATLPTILDSPTYAAGRTLVIVTWDEGKGTDQRVYTVLISPEMTGTVISGAYTHYSLLRYIEDVFGKGHLRGASTAASMAGEPGL